MSDELDDLKRAFDAATPEADTARKRENIALAEKNFAALQGSREAARQTVQKGRMPRLLNGVKTMTTFLTSRAGLTASTALVAVGLVAILPNMPGPEVSLMPEPAVLGSVDERSEDVTWLEDEVTSGVTADQEAGDLIAPNPPAVGPAAPLAEAAPVPEAIIMAEPAPLGAEAFGRQRLSQALKQSDRALVAPQAGVRIAPPADAIIRPESDTEAFASAPENTLKVVTEDPVSTFSIDVDTASYGVVRSSLTAGVLPPRDAVRVEEMVNYFPYAYPAADGPHPFEPTISVVPTPWNDGTQLVHIGIQGEMPAVEERPPLNLVFLIDTSGSMQDANKLPLLKQSFRLMLSELRPEDEVSIVTYAGSAGQVLEATPAAERSMILDALDRLEAGGSTAGQQGLQQAYQVAEAMAGDGEVTRVILATDGDFNVGLSDPDA
ncbi:MAG: von Willebrand factor type A domain-containing protein, partial [Pseudomonadota bacterium]